MTQRLFFRPSDFVAPSFQPVLDGNPCNMAVTWNVAAQRFYINIYGSRGTLILAAALVETRPSVPLASLQWMQGAVGPGGVVIATFETPQPWRKVGQIVQWTIAGCQPPAYNGTYDCLTLSPTSFSFPLTPNPGQAVLLGWAERRLDMIGPWFMTSTMFYRNGVFEVNP